MTNKKPATFDQLIADSQPETKEVEVGGHIVIVQELSGKDRFEMAEMSDVSRWDLLTWVCMRGMIKPKPDKETYLEKMRPEWIVKIATAITSISGVTEEAIEEAGEGSADGSDTGGS